MHVVKLEVHHVNHILRLQKVVKEILESLADWPFKVMMNNELKATVWQSKKARICNSPSLSHTLPIPAKLSGG